MKKLLLISLSLFIVVLSKAQMIKVNEPEFSGNIVYVNDTIGEGIKLEQQTASMTTKVNGATYIPGVNLFAGKATSRNVVKGCCSPVVINNSKKVYFIIKMSDNSVDPTTIINIFKLVSKKESRTVELASSRVLGGTKSGDISYVSFSGKKYGQSSYLIEVDSFEPGQYAITLPERRDIFSMFEIK